MADTIPTLFRALGLGAALTLAACGGDDGETGTAEKEAEKAADSAAGTEGAKAPQPKADLTAEEKAYAEKNRAYLEENAGKDGFKTTESGLQYKIKTEGTGETPNKDDFVVVHYEGRLIDGTVFDSSYERGEPATFPAGRLIEGWVEALSMMKEGAEWTLVIPSDLAYGDMDRGPIPANSTLIFDMVLKDIKTRAQIEEELKAPQRSYLEDNAEKDGVTVTDSGLQYRVLEAGDGASPDANDKVTVHYEGRLVDGTVFDSSYNRGEPATFPVDRVIPGWTEALQKMQVGDKWELAIPHDLAYGERGMGRQIPPYATLIFDVELKDVAPVEQGATDDTGGDGAGNDAGDGGKTATGGDG